MGLIIGSKKFVMLQQPSQQIKKAEEDGTKPDSSTNNETQSSTSGQTAENVENVNTQAYPCTMVEVHRGITSQIGKDFYSETLAKIKAPLKSAKGYLNKLYNESLMNVVGEALKDAQSGKKPDYAQLAQDVKNKITETLEACNYAPFQPQQNLTNENVNGNDLPSSNEKAEEDATTPDGGVNVEMQSPTMEPRPETTSEPTMAPIGLHSPLHTAIYNGIKTQLENFYSETLAKIKGPQILAKTIFNAIYDRALHNVANEALESVKAGKTPDYAQLAQDVKNKITETLEACNYDPVQYQKNLIEESMQSFDEKIEEDATTSDGSVNNETQSPTMEPIAPQILYSPKHIEVANGIETQLGNFYSETLAKIKGPQELAEKLFKGLYDGALHNVANEALESVKAGKTPDYAQLAQDVKNKITETLEACNYDLVQYQMNLIEESMQSFDA